MLSQKVIDRLGLVDNGNGELSLPHEKYNIIAFEYDWKDRPKRDSLIELSICNGKNPLYGSFPEKWIWDKDKFNNFLNVFIKRFEDENKTT